MAHLEDLRKKVLAHILKFGSIKSAIKIFNVSRSSIQRWQNRHSDIGSVAKKARECEPYKVKEASLRSFIESNPESYLYEIADHFNVSVGCIAMALQRLKITRKKRLQNT